MRLLKLVGISLFIFLYHTILFGQSAGTGTVRGAVIDESTRRPLEFVNVTLRNEEDSSVVGGNVSDRNGKFEINNVGEGTYRVIFSLIGYAGKQTPAFKIDPLHRHLVVGAVVLTETTISMDEVLVTSQKELFNNSIDRKVYNVEQDIMSKTGSASELLQNVPSIEVDIDGNVSLRGSSNVLILINGKNSPLMGKSRAEVLQQMPASSIEKIEVITNPSAKYKPDGTAGIINLVLKKNVSPGLNGGVTVNGGNRDRYNGNVRLNYNSGDMNIYGNAGLRQDTRVRTNADARTQVESAGSTILYNQDLTSNSRPLSKMFSLGTDYALDTSNGFGVAGNYFRNSFTRIEGARAVEQNASHILTADFQRNRHDDEFEEEYGVNVFFQHNFSGEEHKLRFEMKASNAPEQEDNHYTNIYAVPSISNSYDNTLLNQGEKHTELSLEYSNPIDKNSEFESGYNGEFSTFTFDLYATYVDPQQQLVNDLTKSNTFSFDEVTHALFATYKNQLGKVSFLAGLRTEVAGTKSHLGVQDSIISTNYFNLYPTLHLSYELNDAAEMQLNYSRRTRRPEIDDMNPFPEYQDPRTLNRGNPHLLPEYIHSVELGCKLQNDYISILPSIYYRYTYNQFTTVTQSLNDSTVERIHVNLSNDRAVGAEVVFSGSVNRLFTANVSGNIYRDQIDASNLGYSSNKSVVSWSGASTFTVNLMKATIMQVNVKYQSERLSPQGKYAPSYTINMGLRQTLMDNALSLVLTAADIFKTVKREITIDTPALYQQVINRRDAQVFYFGLTYTFGKPPKAGKDEPLKYEDNL